MQRRYFQRILLVTLILLVIGFVGAIRWVGLTDYPPGFYKDEAAMTVNGYSILKTGKDEYGVLWPVFFRSFDDWKAPIFIYSQLPVLQLWGQQILATRLTAALWGFLTIAAFGWLVWIVYKKYWVVLIGVLALGILPWHFHFSRIGFELITVPFFTVLLLISLFRWLETKRLRWYLLFITVSGVSMYTYLSARVMSPILMLGLSLWFVRRLGLKSMVLATGLFFICLIPLLWWADRYPTFLMDRYNSVTIISPDKSYGELTVEYAKAYALHFTPSFWFLKGDHNLRHSVQYHYPLLWTMAIPFLIGFVSTIKKYRQPWHQIILFFLLTFPLVSALTTDPPHVHRVIHIIPVVGLLLIEGVLAMVTATKRLYDSKLFLGRWLSVGLLSLWGGVLGYEWQVFYDYYRTPYRLLAQDWFHVADLQALQALRKYPLPHQVSKKLTEFRWSSYQLLRATDPRQIQQGTTRITFFDLENLDTLEPGYYLLKEDECRQFIAKVPFAILRAEPDNTYCIYELNF